MKGIKFDIDKPRWDLLPYSAIEEVVKVLTYGAKKYKAYNWQKVDPLKERYFTALMRHLTSWWENEKLDSETKYNHLAHAGCCLLFLLWKDLQDN